MQKAEVTQRSEVRKLAAGTGPVEWRESGRMIRVGAHEIFVIEMGVGEPVLAMHAFPTSSYDYSRIAPRLAEHFRLILFDYPGFGFSNKPRPHAYSLFEYASVLQGVAIHFGVEQAPLLVHDIGDSVALEILRRGTPIVEKLVMMNGSVLSIPFDDWSMRIRQRAMIHPVIGPLIGKLGLINKTAFRSMMKPLFSTRLPDNELDAFWSVVTAGNGAPLLPTLMQYMPERWTHQHAWLDALEHHHAPLTLIWGMADPVATPAVAGEVVRRRPDATYHRLEGIGHYPHWEDPERVANLILAALEA